MKRSYSYKTAKYNVELRNFQDEFLRNMLLNLYKNGNINIGNSADFFMIDDVSTELENKLILRDLYNLLISSDSRTIETLPDGSIENINIDIEDISEQNKETSQAETNQSETVEQPIEQSIEQPKKRRGRPKGSKNK